ncbi:type VII secretion target [Nocardia sp. NPDC127579]|uniref:type VII secretion target n=1 Tax=Nocardia sp. NPDC127579 TaxID=3345402 RepID=UPI00363BEC25
MTDFHVVPQSLRTAANEMGDAADNWETAQSEIRQFPLKTGSCGSYAEFAPQAFTQIADVVATKLVQSKGHISQGVEVLKLAAKLYEEKDYEFYSKFGYQDEQLGR